MNYEHTELSYNDAFLSHENSDSKELNASAKKRGCCTVFSSGDEEEITIRASGKTASALRSESTARSNVYEIHKFTLMRHLGNISGINSCIYYVGGAFSFLSYHVNDKSSSISLFVSAYKRFDALLTVFHKLH